MRKILATLAVAPLALSSCFGGDDAPVRGWPTPEKLELFGVKYTVEEATALFANKGEKVKEMIENAGPTENLIKGLGFKTIEEPVDVYSFTSINGDEIVEKTEREAFDEFVADAENTRVSEVTGAWRTAVRTGQHQVNGTSKPTDGEVYAAANYQVQDLGLTNSSTVLTIPPLGTEFASFSGNTYSNGLAALTGGVTPDHEEVKFTLGSRSYSPTSFQVPRDHELYVYVPNIERSSGWHVGATGVQTQHFKKGSFENKLQKNTVGANDFSTVTHTDIFTSWYLEDTRFLEGSSDGNAWGGGWLDVKFANFKADGTYIRDVAIMYVPRFKGTGANSSELKSFYGTNLLTPLNKPGISFKPTVKKAGSAILEPGFVEGVALYNHEDRTYAYYENDADGWSKLPVWTNRKFLGSPVRAAFRSWLSKNTIGTVVKGQKLVTKWKWYGAWINPNREIGWHPATFSTKEELYKNVCERAASMYLTTANDSEPWICYG